MKIWRFPVLLVFFRHVAYGGDAIDEVFNWLISNGAKVHDGLHGTFFQHGDANVRGVVASDEVSADSSVMTIPKKLWLEPRNYPDFMNSELPSSCDIGDSYWQREVKFSAAIASEVQKGTSSFYYPYLKNCPTMADFESFVPWTMDQDIQTDFAALPLGKDVKDVQAHFKRMQTCFDSWAQASNSPAKSVTWEHTLLALFWLRTRSYTVWDKALNAGENVMIPGVDMVNTVEGSDLNVDYRISEEGFSMMTYNHPVSSGVELVENYCSNCTNAKMVWLWGVYLESNPFTINAEPGVCTGEAGMHMKEVTTASLKDVASLKVDNQRRSPRCLKETLERKQGPLRCSMARIAWETCATSWGLTSSPPPAAPQGKLSEEWRGSESDFDEWMFLSKQRRVLRYARRNFRGQRL
jgi:hypothetical protein